MVELGFRLADDLRTVTGTETVRPTPDLPTGELVLHLVPDGPEPAAAGNRLVLDAARGDDVAGSGCGGAGAEEPGGLHVVRLADRLAAGEATEVALDFTLPATGPSPPRRGTAGAPGGRSSRSPGT